MTMMIRKPMLNSFLAISLSTAVGASLAEAHKGDKDVHAVAPLLVNPKLGDDVGPLNGSWTLERDD
jgi:hypothetical protein